MCSCRVLLVDDERPFMAVMAKRLDRRGFEVRCAHGGREALERAGEGEPDVAVLDVRMPGMDGMRTMAALGRIAPGTQVILLTGHADMDAAMRGMRAGAFDYLAKPVDIEELAQKIRAAYERRLTGAGGSMQAHHPRNGERKTHARIHEEVRQ